MVRKAAKLAVYEEIIIRVKNHQQPATIRVDTARGAISQPKGDDIKNMQDSTLKLKYGKITNAKKAGEFLDENCTFTFPEHMNFFPLFSSKYK